MSPESGKTDCHIIDLVDSVANANGLIVTPTLLGLSLDEMDVEDHGRQSAESTKPRGGASIRSQPTSQIKKIPIRANIPLPLLT